MLKYYNAVFYQGEMANFLIYCIWSFGVWVLKQWSKEPNFCGPGGFSISWDRVKFKNDF